MGHSDSECYESGSEVSGIGFDPYLESLTLCTDVSQAKMGRHKAPGGHSWLG
jgi:hypothetical protein